MSATPYFAGDSNEDEEEEDDCFYFPGIGDELKDIDYSSEPMDCPLPEHWKDIECSYASTKFTIDQSKDNQWEIAKDEIKHVRSSFSKLCKVDEGEIEPYNIFKYYIGTESDFGMQIKKILEFDDETYCKFMHTACVQGADNKTPKELFHRKSPGSKGLLIDYDDYIELWKKIAELNKMDTMNFFGEGRRERLSWEAAEKSFNESCRELSILRRRGIISIALDDDKVWVALKRSLDMFGIKLTTHSSDNRKGIVMHTAISSGAQIPLGIAVEREKDTANSSFKRILNFLFKIEAGGEYPNLQNVLIASDRGYMLPTLTFQYLVHSGCRIIGTTKRMVQGWPFTFCQTMNKNDKRTLIDENGAATLYVKKINKNNQSVFAIAFRNGTGRVNTSISSVHRDYHWEGVAHSPADAELYHSRDPDTREIMMSRGFENVNGSLGLRTNKEDDELLKQLRTDTVKIVTIGQGKYKSFLIVALFFKFYL